MSETPWTRRVYVPWVLPVHFYTRRWDALEHFDTSDRLLNYRVVDDRIAMRLGDAYHLVSFGEGYVDAALLRPDADASVIYETLGVLFDRLEPRQLLSPVVDIQWLEELGLTYDEARTSTAKRVVGDVKAEIVDWSMNIDATVDSPAGSLKAEYGIVSSFEAALRLARTPTRFVGPTDPDVPPSLWPPATLPDVAWFFDSRCSLTEPIDSPTVEAVIDLWSRVHSALGEVHSSFKRAFFGRGSGAK